MSAILRERLNQVLSGTTAITDLVQDRIFSSKPAPGIAFPLITFEIIGSPRIGSLDNGNSGGLENASVVVRCMALDDYNASVLGELALDALNDTDVFACHESDTSDDYDEFDKTYMVEVTATIMNYTDGR